jgi:hypothetical protein
MMMLTFQGMGLEEQLEATLSLATIIIVTITQILPRITTFSTTAVPLSLPE